MARRPYMASRRKGRAQREHDARADAERARLQDGAGHDKADPAAGRVATGIVWEKSSRSYDDKTDSINNAGANLGLQGKAKEAIRYFEDVLARFPDHYTANVNIGNCLRDFGKPEKALEHYARAIKAEPGLSAGYYMTGYVLYDLGRFDEAAEALGKALERAPSLVPAMIRRGASLAATGRISDALEEYDKALRMGDNVEWQFQAAYEKGAVLLADNRVKEAMKCYKMAARTRPDEPGPYAGMGHVYGRLRRYDRAIAYYKRAIKLRPDDPRAYANIATCLSECGKYDRALKYADRALKVDPTYAFGHSVRARILVQSGGAKASAMPDAMASMLKAVGSDPRFADDPLGSHKHGRGALREGAS